MKKNKDMLQNKRPYNEQGEAHGYWETTLSGDAFLQTYFINDIPHGYLYYRPLLKYNGEIRELHEYYAK
jgi:hypothetical protein